MLVQKIALETNEKATLELAHPFNVQLGEALPELLPDALSLLEDL
jgi:hypothetical protein